MSQSFLPIRGRVAGISLLEALEGLHDLLKTTLDQTVDSGTLKNAPFGFYRPTGSMKPETIRMVPGELYPLGNPKDDINIPQFANANESFGFNMMTMIGQFEERLTTIGDFQLGRVPAGKSSALRTASGMAMLAGQGEARPERILRRYFSGLAEIFALMHSLNQAFLPEKKKLRITGALNPGEDAYLSIGSREDINGDYDFDFDANVLNTSKAALQENLEALMSTYINEMTLQLGIIDGEGIYRMLRDYGRARGQDPQQYINEPTPGANRPRIFAEDALQIILSTMRPDGLPAEAGGAIEHMEKLLAFQEADELGLLDANQLEIYKVYVGEIGQLAQQQAQQQQLAQAANAFSQGGGQGGQGGRPPTQAPPSLDNPQINGGELLDESLPSAGGGGQ